MLTNGLFLVGKHLAVYTSLTLEQIKHFLNAYQLPELLCHRGISDGIENTNYLIKTKDGDFILTVYEYFTAQQALHYLSLLQQLATLEKYYPEPIKPIQGNVLQQINNRPAALFKCLPGSSVDQASPLQTAAIAKALAQLHLSASQLNFSQINSNGLDWIQQVAEKILPRLNKQDAVLLMDECQYQSQVKLGQLEQGVIHADLFKDNVLFSGDSLTGFLDFYAACNDVFLLDIAIAANDWCVDKYGVFQKNQYQIFIQSYQQLKPLRDKELVFLDVFLRRACLRFWLSRLEHQFNPKAGEITLEKLPERFRNLLYEHRKRVSG